MSYADKLRKKAKEEVRELPVLPTGYYNAQVVGRGSLNPPRSDHEKAPDVLVRFPIRNFTVADVDEDLLDEAVKDQQFTSVEELLSAAKLSIEMPVWSGDSEEDDLRIIRNRIRGKFGKEAVPARCDLETALAAPTEQDIFVQVLVEKKDGTEGPVNWSVNWDNVAPVE